MAVTDHRVGVEIHGRPGTAAVYVNGHLLACEAATLELDANTLIPVLTVKLPVTDDIVLTLAEVKAGFAEETKAALVAMGWKPPDGG